MTYVNMILLYLLEHKILEPEIFQKIRYDIKQKDKVCKENDKIQADCLNQTGTEK